MAEPKATRASAEPLRASLVYQQLEHRARRLALARAALQARAQTYEREGNRLPPALSQAITAFSEGIDEVQGELARVRTPHTAQEGSDDVSAFSVAQASLP